jgi:two-component system sensor histidine kinase/response regulator
MRQAKFEVLSIEDDPGDALILRRHLENIPGRDITMHDFRESSAALAELARADIDIIFVDYMLPTETGLDVLNAIRDSGDPRPVVIVTGQGDEELAAQVMQAGASGYLPKRALSSASLDRCISDTIERHLLRQSLEAHRRRLERINRDLDRTNKEIRSLYPTVSPELNTPLTSACEFLSLVSDGTAGPLTDTQREYLAIARECCDRMAACINDLVDITMLETGKMVIDPGPITPGALISRAAAAMVPIAQRKGIRLRHWAEADLPTVLVDEIRMAQVLANLLSNALKFTERGGEVAVSAGVSANWPGLVTISVTDTGPGIETEHLDRIFDPLYQVERREAPDRIGLGLAICRELVKLHGGDIWVESELGKGSTFSFTIPQTCTTPPCGATSAPDRKDPTR